MQRRDVTPLIQLSALPSPTAQTRWRYLRVGLLYALVWTITWYLARLLGELGGASLWFLPAGLRFTAIFLLGWRGVLLELVTVWAVSVADFLWAGGALPPVASAQMAWMTFQWLSPVLAYALVLLPLRVWLPKLWNFRQALHSTVFLGASIACAALAAWGGSFGLTQIGAVETSQIMAVWSAWLVGDFIGLVTLAPVLLVWAGPPLARYLGGYAVAVVRQPKAHAPGVAGPTVLIASVSLLLVIGVPSVLRLSADLPFFALLLLLPLAGLALQWGLRSALLAVIVFDCGLVLWLAGVGHNDMALRYQLVMLAIALVGLWLGGVVDARQHTLQRYRDFSHASNDLLWEVDPNGNLQGISGRLAKHMALPPGQHWHALLSGGEPEQLQRLESYWLQQQSFRHLEVALHTPVRATRWIQLNGQPVWSPAGEWQGYRGTAVDVSKARRARTLLHSYNQQLREQVAKRTQELQNNERHLQVLLAAAPAGVMELDAQARCCFINESACALTGYAPDEALGCALLDFVHPEDRSQFDDAWMIYRQSDTVHTLEFRLMRTQRWCSVNWIHLKQPDGSELGSVLVLTDATARRQHDQLLWSLAHHDTLTKLPNRSLFMDRCEQALSMARRNHSCAAVMWVDLDGFKAVNDTLGHAAGDQLLIEVAQRLTSRVRGADTVARMGGDEFALVMTGVDNSTQSEKMAAEMVAILAQPYHLREGQATVTASVGVALYPQDARTVDDLIRCADLAMYAAKRGGKNKEISWGNSGLAPLD